MKNKIICDVSIAVLTYNHVNTLPQCLESLLMQRANCSFEIVIADDCSNDGAVELLWQYVKKYPDQIRMLPNDYNRGICPNIVRLFKACTGKYTMICEGDDWWEDGKLQKQFDYMESHPDCSICYTDFNEYYEGIGQTKPAIIQHLGWQANRETLSWKAQLTNMRFWFATASICCRNDRLQQCINEDAIWQDQTLSLADLIIRLGVGQRGEVGFIPEVLCTYRINVCGNSASRLKDPQKMIKLQLDDLKIRRFYMNNTLDSEEEAQVMGHYIRALIPIVSLMHRPAVLHNLRQWIVTYQYMLNKRERLLLAASKYFLLGKLLSVYRNALRHNKAGNKR